VIVRRVLWLTVPFPFVMLLMLTVVLALPHEYESACVISVLEQKSNTPDEWRPVERMTSEQILRTKYGLLDGLNLLEVTADLGLDQQRLADTSARALVSRIRRKVPWLEPRQIDDTELADRLITHFQRRVAVQRAGKNGISVAYRGTDAEFNARLVNAIVDQFIKQSAKSRPATAAMDLRLIEARLAQHRAKMEDSQRQIDEFRARRLVDVASEVEAARSELERDRKELETARRNLREVSAEFTAMENRISASERSEPSMSNEEAELRIRGLRQTIARLEVQLSQMKTTLTDKHRRVVAREGEIAELREELADEEKALLVVSADEVDPEIEKLRARETQLVAERDRERTLIDALVAEVREKETRLRSLSADKRRFDEFTREHMLNEELYNNYLKRLASVQLGEEPGQVTFSANRYEILEKAYATSIPIGPERWRLAAFGTLLAVFICLATALGVELIDRGLHGAAEVPGSVGMPARSTAQSYAAAGTLERRGTVKRAAWYALFTLMYCLAIFAVSSVARPPAAFKWITKHDLMAHVVMYGGLGWFVGMTVRAGAIRMRTWQYWIVPVVFIALYGMTDELHQWFVLGRQCSLSDWVADVMGGSAAQLVFPLHVRWHRWRGK